MRTLQDQLKEKGLDRLASESILKLLPNSSQGFASSRILLDDKCPLTFRVRCEGYGFGNSCPYLYENEFSSLAEAESWFIIHLEQGWAISSKYSITVFSRKCSFWSFSWGGSIPQSERIDKKAKLREFESWFSQKLNAFREAYRYVYASQEENHSYTYLCSEVDRYHPDVEI